MIESLSPALFVTFAFGALIFILFMLLPAFFAVERKNASNEKQNCQLKISSMEQIDEHKVDSLVVRRLAEVIAVLPDMES